MKPTCNCVFVFPWRIKHTSANQARPKCTTKKFKKKIAEKTTFPCRNSEVFFFCCLTMRLSLLQVTRVSLRGGYLHCSTCTIAHPLTLFHGAPAEQTQGQLRRRVWSEAGITATLLALCFSLWVIPMQRFSASFVPGGSTRQSAPWMHMSRANKPLDQNQPGGHGSKPTGQPRRRASGC